MVDMAHYAGSGRGGVYPNPFAARHIVTTTTHKTLRGPRGGMILTNSTRPSPRRSTRRCSPAFRAAR